MRVKSKASLPVLLTAALACSSETQWNSVTKTPVTEEATNSPQSINNPPVVRNDEAKAIHSPSPEGVDTPLEQQERQVLAADASVIQEQQPPENEVTPTSAQESSAEGVPVEAPVASPAGPAIGALNPTPVASTPAPPAPPPACGTALALSFKQIRGDASFRNCVAISLNGASYVDLGCNHDGDLTKEFGFAAKQLPENNTVRLKYTTNGKLQGTTEAGAILPRLKIEKPERFALRIGYEDTGDNDFNDYIIEIKAQCSIKLQIENCDSANCKIE